MSLADYYTQMTVQPEIPEDLLTEAELDFLARFGIEAEKIGHRKLYYLYAAEYDTTGYDYDEGGDGDEDELIEFCQALIKSSKGRLKFIYFEFAYTCNRMRPGAFGGGAYFITATGFQFVSTSQWLMERVNEVETGNTRD